MYPINEPLSGQDIGINGIFLEPLKLAYSKIAFIKLASLKLAPSKSAVCSFEFLMVIQIVLFENIEIPSCVFDHA